MSETLIQSYVYGKEAYFVSTILRDSSADLCPNPYYETMVWRYDVEKKERYEMFVDQVDSGSFPLDAMTMHNKICIKWLTGAGDIV